MKKLRQSSLCLMLKWKVESKKWLIITDSGEAPVCARDIHG